MTLWVRGDESAETVMLPYISSEDRNWVPHFDSTGEPVRVPGKRGIAPRQEPGSETTDQARARGLPLAPSWRE